MPISCEHSDELLTSLEETIERGMRQFLAVGAALAKILKARLYWKASYESFERYCKVRWGMSRPHAYRLVEACTVAANLEGFACPTYQRTATTPPHKARTRRAKAGLGISPAGYT